MAGKNNSHVIVWDILGVLVVGYLALKILPTLLRGVGGGSGNYAGTYGSGASGVLPFTYRSANGQVQTSGDAGSIIGALIKSLIGSKTPSKPLANLGPPGGSLPFSGLLKPSSSSDTTIAQALLDPNYSGPASQDLLAGIFNIQQGYGDFSGDTRNQVISDFGIDPGNYGVSGYDTSGLDSIQIPYDTSSLETLDNLPTTDVSSSGDAGSSYYDTPSDYYIDPGSSDGGGYSF
jgi:hypothetical protein